MTRAPDRTMRTESPAAGARPSVVAGLGRALTRSVGAACVRRAVLLGFAAAVFLSCVGVAPLSAQGSSPSRPSPPRVSAPAPAAAPTAGVRTFLGATYVEATAWAARFGLKVSWLERGRRLQLFNQTTRIILEADRREVELDDLRVFLGEPIVESGGQLWLGTVDAATLLGAIIRPASIPGSPPALRVICLDAGHGGTDTGTQNRRLKLDEKALTLDVAQRVRRLLEAKGYRVVMTRSDDRFVELEDRAAFANRAKADLFVSIHFNAFPQPGVTGTETYILTRRGQRSTGAAKRESSDQVGLPGHRADPWNAVLGHAIHRQLVGRLNTADRGLKFGRFKVLTLVNCPGVLVESGYLSNEAEARRIATPAYRADIAAGIVAGIESYEAQLRRPAR
ncbi:MAG: N-acetylmuramoyl-L-alanine amidase [Verrucomicrobia bacterium]|nr:N-acetylmuramoyl-L-alanine amidase [Verrucomicrobiota bacterium]